MNKLFITATMLVFFFLTGFLGQSEPCYNSDFDGGLIKINQPTEIVVKGFMHEGVVYPMIMLPTVEVKGQVEERRDVVKAVYEDGQIYPHIELSEIVITPNS